MSIPKTVLVTGGAKRVGRAICEDLAAAGYAVAIHYNTSGDEAGELADEIKANGGTAAAVGADLAKSGDIHGLMEKARDAIGPVGILVNNASLFEDDGFDAQDDALWDAHFSVHVKAPCVLTAGLAAQLPGDAEGLAVNIIDERVWKLTPKYASYTLSKSALWTATQTMAQAFAPRLRVNAIGPGPTLPSQYQSKEEFDGQIGTLPLRRAPDLAEFACTILYLAGARSVTGQMLALDGGQHLAWETPDQRAGE